jgi:hypothetical protein
LAYVAPASPFSICAISRYTAAAAAIAKYQLGIVAKFQHHWLFILCFFHRSFSFPWADQKKPNRY